jgi:hypothetical protein
MTSDVDEEDDGASSGTESVLFLPSQSPSPNHSQEADSTVNSEMKDETEQSE